MNENAVIKSSKFKVNKSIIFLVGVTLFIYLFFKIQRPSNFGNLSNLFSYLQQALMPTVAACGFYFIIVMGLFDFSLGSNIVLSAIVGVLLSRYFGYFGLVFGAIIVGSTIGLLNGIIYIKLKIPSIIVTIGLMILYECLGALLANGTVLTLNDSLNKFGRAPYNIILAVIAFVLTYMVLQRTKIGIYTYAIGSNEKIAATMGINVNKYKIIAFVLCGFFAGLMSVLTISYGGAISSATNMSSMSRNFTPIMGCFFGLAFKKTINPVISMLIGEFIITMILNGLISIGVPTTIQNIVTGVTLLIIVVFTTKIKKGEVVK